MTQPLPLDEDSIARLRREARDFRDDVIALRFGWDMAFLHGVADKMRIPLSTKADYLRAHPQVAARYATTEGAAAGDDDKAQACGQRGPRIATRTEELRSVNVVLTATPTCRAAIEAEAATRGVKRGTLLTLTIERIVKENLWGEILE